jgi:hypothetical protein
MRKSSYAPPGQKLPRNVRLFSWAARTFSGKTHDSTVRWILGRVAFLFLFFHSLLPECESNVLLRSSRGNELRSSRGNELLTTLVRVDLWRQNLSFLLFHIATSESHNLSDQRRRILCGFGFLLIPIFLPCHLLHNKRFDSARREFLIGRGGRKFNAEHKKSKGKYSYKAAKDKKDIQLSLCLII